MEIAIVSPRCLYRVGEEVLVLCRLIEGSAAGRKVMYPEDVRVEIFKQTSEGQRPAATTGLRRAFEAEDWQVGDIRLFAKEPGQFTVVAHANNLTTDLDVFVLSPQDYDEYWRSCALEAFIDNRAIGTTDELAEIVSTEVLASVEEQLIVAQTAVTFEVMSQLDYRAVPPEGSWAVPRDAFAWHAELLFQAAMEGIAGDGAIRVRVLVKLNRVVLQIAGIARAHRGKRPVMPTYITIVKEAGRGQSGWEYEARLRREVPTWELSFTRHWGNTPPTRAEKPELAPAGGSSRREPDEMVMQSRAKLGR